ncbi:hypothetical protein PM082_016524 [Marasmius tenuissimus]|nr:hypothetical protein PM082_016524 [Marasmius tenuissimus]
MKASEFLMQNGGSLIWTHYNPQLHLRTFVYNCCQQTAQAGTSGDLAQSREWALGSVDYVGSYRPSIDTTK